MAFVETPKFPGAVASETDLHNYKNVVPSDSTGVTLASGITSTATSATVSSGQGSKMPADNFVIVIDDENIFVTTRVGDVLTVTRGYEGSTTAAHSAGADVRAVITAKGHNQLASEVHAIETELGVNGANYGRLDRTNDFTAVQTFSAGSDTRGPINIAPATAPGTGPFTPGDMYIHTDGSMHWIDTSGVKQSIQSSVKKDVANGYPGLDASGLILATELPDATPTTKGAIELNTDLGGSASAPNVVGLQGRGVSSSVPSTDNGLVWNGTLWVPTGVVKSSQINAASGVAGLDASSLLNEDQMTYITKAFDGGAVSKGASSTAEQTMKTLALVANYLNVAGRGLHVITGGTYSTGTSAPNITINLKLDTVVLGSWVLTAAASASSWDWFADFWVVAASTGTSGTVRTTGMIGMVISTPGATNTTRVVPLYNGTNVDLTAAHSLTLTATFSVSNASNAFASNVWGVFRHGN